MFTSRAYTKAIVPTALAVALLAPAPEAAATPQLNQTAAHAVVNYDVALAADSANVLTLGGTTGPFYSTKPKDALQGVLCQGQFVCENVKYPDFVLSMVPMSKKIQILNDRLLQQTEPTVIVGYSQGAVVAQELQKAWDNGDLERPSVEMSFVYIGNPYHELNGFSKKKAVFNKYPTINVSNMYDFFSDFPDHPNFWAVANVVSGLFYNHRHYADSDINGPDNLYYQKGDTTYVLIPQEAQIPKKLRAMGMDKFADAVQEKIDSAYDRSMYVKLTPPEPTDVPNLDETAGSRMVTLDVPPQEEQNSHEQEPVDPAPVSETPAEEPSVDASAPAADEPSSQEGNHWAERRAERKAEREAAQAKRAEQRAERQAARAERKKAREAAREERKAARESASDSQGDNE